MGVDQGHQGILAGISVGCLRGIIEILCWIYSAEYGQQTPLTWWLNCRSYLGRVRNARTRLVMVPASWLFFRADVGYPCLTHRHVQAKQKNLEMICSSLLTNLFLLRSNPRCQRRMPLNIDSHQEIKCALISATKFLQKK
jgi:hypothetical protein